MKPRSVFNKHSQVNLTRLLESHLLIGRQFFSFRASAWTCARRCIWRTMEKVKYLQKFLKAYKLLQHINTPNPTCTSRKKTGFKNCIWWRPFHEIDQSPIYLFLKIWTVGSGLNFEKRIDVHLVRCAISLIVSSCHLLNKFQGMIFIYIISQQLCTTWGRSQSFEIKFQLFHHI